MIQSNLQEVPEGIPKVDNAGFGSIYDHSRVSNLENDTNWGGDSEGWNGNQYIQGMFSTGLPPDQASNEQRFLRMNLHDCQAVFGRTLDRLSGEHSYYVTGGFSLSLWC